MWVLEKFVEIQSVTYIIFRNYLNQFVTNNLLYILHYFQKAKQRSLVYYQIHLEEDGHLIWEKQQKQSAPHQRKALS